MVVKTKDYFKYIVLSHPRSGSSLLMNCLRQHPEVISYGEIFVKKRIGFNSKYYSNDSKILITIRNYFPLLFLNKLIFKNYPKKIKAVGFKLFKNHTHFAKIYKWAKVNNVKIILLHRHNLLEAYISYMIDLNSNSFVSIKSKTPSDHHVTIDKIDFKKYVDEHQLLIDSYKELSKTNEILEVTYEELNINLDNTFKKLTQFLGVENKIIPPKTEKIETRSVREVITNYDVLKADLSNSVYSKYFK